MYKQLHIHVQAKDALWGYGHFADSTFFICAFAGVRNTVGEGAKGEGGEFSPDTNKKECIDNV